LKSQQNLVSNLFFASHQLEVVHLLQLGKDEFAAHVGHLHLQIVNLHVLDVNVAFNIIFLAFGFHPPLAALSSSLVSKSSWNSCFDRNVSCVHYFFSSSKKEAKASRRQAFISVGYCKVVLACRSILLTQP